MAQFEFGDEVFCTKGHIDGICLITRVISDGVTTGYRIQNKNGDFCLANENELQLVPHWVEIDWDDASTLPNWDLVLVYCGYIDFDNLTNGKGGIRFAEHGRNVTHWRPLPQPPK